jgi:four helix bundle protein
MQGKSSKKYDLEERTFIYAKNVIEYIGKLPRGIAHTEISKQLVRSSGSVGANYIEAKICRKEAKESAYWLKLSSPTKSNEETKLKLMCESEELMKIFSAIMRKVQV